MYMQVINRTRHYIVVLLSSLTIIYFNYLKFSYLAIACVYGLVRSTPGTTEAIKLSCETSMPNVLE